MKIRASFPQIYKLTDNKTGNPYYLVSARSRKWGMNERKAFPTEKEALDHARQIESLIQEKGAQSAIPKEKLVLLREYDELRDLLAPHGKTVREAVDFFIVHLGNEILRQAKPPISELADKWKSYKYADTTLSKSMKNEIAVYCRFIKWKWGTMKPDEPKKNEIDLLLKGLKITNNTRRKYLTMIRMFFSWVKDEGHILVNPTDGIYYKSEPFEKRFHQSDTITKVLQYVVGNEKRLVGYYVLLTFAGLRPSEGARVQWQDINFTTNELYVRKGKTPARHIILEPVAIEWLKWFKENSDKDTPFIPKKNLFNLERKVRNETLGQDWFSDHLRHGFATYFKSLKKDINLVADYMGNSVGMIKRHYAQTIPLDELNKFWSLTPERVLDSKGV